MLSLVKAKVYDEIGFTFSNLEIETESTAYAACNFKINGRTIICRNAKVTPKKIGQFVTFWKRNIDGPIAPFHDSDKLHFFVINVSAKNKLGQFIFPKSLLIKKGILSTSKKEGKRGFRVYPSWNKPLSKQAMKTQEWQLDYFYVIDDSIDFIKVIQLYSSI